MLLLRALAGAGARFDAGRRERIKALYPEAESGTDVVEEVLEGRLMALPDNLYLRATMNTSDQSLFPMDSAFKRRWDWEYVAIADRPEEGWEIELEGERYGWWDFLEKVNAEILKATNSEDKQLGYYFVRAREGKIGLDAFVNKVVFYLWNSVFKDCYTDCGFMRMEERDGYFTFTSFFKGGKPDAGQAKAFLKRLGVEAKAYGAAQGEAGEGGAEASAAAGGGGE